MTLSSAQPPFWLDGLLVEARIGSGAGLASPVWLPIIQHRIDRHDTVGVYAFVAVVVVAHDVGEVHGVCDAGHLVELAGVGPEVRVIDQPTTVTFKMPVIDIVKTG